MTPFLTPTLILASLSLMAAGSYLVWFSKRNILAHLSLGFILTAYLIPISATGILHDFPDDLIGIYAQILMVGAALYVVGIYLGYYAPRVRFSPVAYTFESLESRDFTRYIGSWTLLLLTGALIGIWVSFGIMGFVPMFADNPLEAKFFRGDYRAAYQRVSVLYRLSQFVMITLIPIAFMLWYRAKRRVFLWLAVSSVLTLLLALNRGPTAEGVLLFLGVLALRKKGWFAPFFVLVVLIYPFGSSVYHLFGSFLNLANFQRFEIDRGLWAVISSGSPDISDQLRFLSAFLEDGTFTFGKTFVGGLVPGNYSWNPHVWTLTTLNRTSDVNSIVSGGLRLPVAMWGYVSFGWLGVLFVPLFSGFIWGAGTRFARAYTNPALPLQSMLVLVFYAEVSYQFSRFYYLSMYSLPTIAVIVLLTYRVVFFPRWSSRERKHLQISVQQEEPTPSPGSGGGGGFGS